MKYRKLSTKKHSKVIGLLLLKKLILQKAVKKIKKIFRMLILKLLMKSNLFIS